MYRCDHHSMICQHANTSPAMLTCFKVCRSRHLQVKQWVVQVCWCAGVLVVCAGVLVCWCAGCLCRCAGVLVCWLFVQVCWCSGVLVCWLFVQVCLCAGVLVCWCAGCLCRCAGVQVCWCAGVLVVCAGVLVCRCAGVLVGCAGVQVCWWVSLNLSTSNSITLLTNLQHLTHTVKWLAVAAAIFSSFFIAHSDCGPQFYDKVIESTVLIDSCHGSMHQLYKYCILVNELRFTTVVCIKTHQCGVNEGPPMWSE